MNRNLSTKGMLGLCLTLGVAGCGAPAPMTQVPPPDSQSPSQPTGAQAGYGIQQVSDQQGYSTQQYYRYRYRYGGMPARGSVVYGSYGGYRGRGSWPVFVPRRAPWRPMLRTWMPIDYGRGSRDWIRYSGDNVNYGPPIEQIGNTGNIQYGQPRSDYGPSTIQPNPGMPLWQGVHNPGAAAP